MKIISTGDGYEEKPVGFPINVTCEYCGSDLELERTDVDYGAFGAFWYRCPVCKRKCMVDNLDGIKLTVDNIKFPKNFWCFRDGVELEPEDIKDYIKSGVEFFRENPDAFTYVTGSGNTHVMVQNYSGDQAYYVVVAQGYYDAEIPYEDVDYAIQDENNWYWNNRGINLRRTNKKQEEEDGE